MTKELDRALSEPRVILLDLNFTLCANSSRKNGVMGAKSYASWVRDHERYRVDLIERLKERDHTVVLITARPERWKAATMERIERVTGWLPHRAYFNTRDEKPPPCKERIMREFVIPEFGEPGEERKKYLALESNEQTRRMYASIYVAAMRLPDELVTATAG